MGWGLTWEVAQALGHPGEWAGRHRTCRYVDTESSVLSKTGSHPG